MAPAIQNGFHGFQEDSGSNLTAKQICHPEICETDFKFQFVAKNIHTAAYLPYACIIE